MKWLAVDQYSGLFFILGFVFLFCSILLFILFRIPGVFLYLSGSRQKKNIQILRRKREEQKKKGFSLQGKIDMEFLRKRSEEKQEEKRRMAEQAPWKQEGEATAKLLMPEDHYRGQETAPLFSSEALSDASLGTPFRSFFRSFIRSFVRGFRPGGRNRKDPAPCRERTRS